MNNEKQDCGVCLSNSVCKYKELLDNFIVQKSEKYSEEYNFMSIKITCKYFNEAINTTRNTNNFKNYKAK